MIFKLSLNECNEKYFCFLNTIFNTNLTINILYYSNFHNYHYKFGIQTKNMHKHKKNENEEKKVKKKKIINVNNHSNKKLNILFGIGVKN